MPKPRRPKRRTRIFAVDGDVHLVVERTSAGITTKRLVGAEREHVLKALDDAQYELAAKILGHRRPPR